MGNVVFEHWIDAMGSCTADVCAITPDQSLDNGEYSWQVQTWNTAGYGPWSSAMQFAIESSEPNEKMIFLPLVIR